MAADLAVNMNAYAVSFYEIDGVSTYDSSFLVHDFNYGRPYTDPFTNTLALCWTN